jgi:hypothetical protein
MKRKIKYKKESQEDEYLRLLEKYKDTSVFIQNNTGCTKQKADYIVGKLIEKERYGRTAYPD